MVSHNAVMPSVSLTPGLRLRTEVGVALHELEQGGEAVLHVVRDNLRGALAYTAAIGETSMVARGAEAVRLAAGRLEAGLVGPACVALTEALSCLSPALPPVPREPAFGRSVVG
ncbi:hypothetical protein JOF56_005543 [Kibdelosporangium banguiense]|uniref:Uncharacterized protein n=1 Tax=Kibdelosporangium banguiense TaxID=1365924 RepID=A0ABS4TL55_9PSEU|nr:hypothetical protein [Kibdelosporangium banguiense]MBP2325158.1 hypothetical protein [Kibdelosporangium banguiense]